MLTVTEGVAMAIVLSRSAGAKISLFRKKWPFLLQNVFISDFFGTNSKSASQN